MVALFSVMVGCNSENPLNITDRTSENNIIQNTKQAKDNSYVINLPIANIHLESATSNKEDKRLDIRFSYKYKNNDFVSRILTFEEVEDMTTIYQVRVSDIYNELMFSFYVYPDPTDTNSIYLCEKTPFDSLSIHKTVYGEIITEVYNLNGEIYNIQFTEDEINKYLIEQSKKVSRFASNNNTNDDKFTGFLDFYPEKMTLNNNIDGSIMVLLTQNEEFLHWLKDQTGLSGSDNFEKLDVDGLCDLANIGTAKCLLGGVANPICHVAVGVSFACGVRTIIGWFS